MRTLIGLWKANGPQWIWLVLPLWIGPITIGLDGKTPEWSTVALFLLAVTAIMANAEFANTYADREEDWLYIPSNPLVTGELQLRTARTVFILQNVAAALLMLALLLVTLNWALIVTMAVGWFLGLSYSLPPFRFKETVGRPFSFALGLALLSVVAWLSVEPSLTARNGFIVAFASFLFLHSFGYAITNAFRKTTHARNRGLISTEEAGNIHNLGTVGFKLKVRTAMALEAFTAVGAFVLVPVFWRMGIFEASLSIALLTLPLALTVLATVLRMREPVKYGGLCTLFITLAWLFIVLSLMGVALSSLLHWGYVVLICAVFLIVFHLLVTTVFGFSGKAPWREI